MDARRHRRTRCSTPPQVAARWPQFVLPDGTVGRPPGPHRHRARGARAPPRCSGARRRTARRCATTTRRRVDRCRDAGGVDVEVDAGGVVVPRAAGVVVTADAWTNEVLAPARRRAAADGDRRSRSPTSRPPDPARVRPDGSRCGSGWTSRPSTASRPTARRPSRPRRTAAGPPVTGDDRTSDPDPGMRDRLLADFMAATAPRLRAGRPVAALPVHADARPRLRPRPAVPGTRPSSSGSGRRHGFKFAPTFGRMLADLAVDGRRAADRPLGVPPRPARPHRPRLRPELDGVNHVDSAEINRLQLGRARPRARHLTRLPRRDLRAGSGLSEPRRAGSTCRDSATSPGCAASTCSATSAPTPSRSPASAHT